MNQEGESCCWMVGEVVVGGWRMGCDGCATPLGPLESGSERSDPQALSCCCLAPTQGGKLDTVTYMHANVLKSHDDRMRERGDYR